MVVAHLRGLLPEQHHYGVRSLVTEGIVLESLNAELLAHNSERRMELEMAMLPVLNPQGIQNTVQRVHTRLGRASELRLLDIYRVAEQVAGLLKLENKQNQLSLFQVYQIAEKEGIFDAFDEYYTEENSKPLL